MNRFAAISTLLSPPIVRTGLLPHTGISSTSGFKAPSARDIPPVALTNIPHVDPTTFQPYLSQVGSLYESFQRAKEVAEDGAGALPKRNRDEAKTQELEQYLSKRFEGRPSSSSGFPRQSSFSSLSSPVRSPQTKRRASAQRRGPMVTPLSTIPDVYFEEDFHLENPRTFDIVSERSEVIRQQPGPWQEQKEANGKTPMPRKALATNAILQEKLSWYMDTVEIHLISSISTASTSFFAALGSLRELHAEAADSVKKIQGLRRDLAKLDREMAVGGLKVVNMRRRRENVRKLGEAVLQLGDIVNAVSQCDDMVDEGKFEEALEGLGEVEKLIAGDSQSSPPTKLGFTSMPPEGPRRLLDLRGLKALDGASRDLDQLRARIGKGFEARFLEVLLYDIRRHVDHVPPRDTIERWQRASQRARGGHRPGPSISPAYTNLDDDLRSQLKAQLGGLARSNSSSSAAGAFREAILRETKGLIRRHLPSSSDEDTESTVSASTIGGRQLSQQEKSSILARNLRALDVEDAEEMLLKIYAGVGEALRRLGVQVKLLLDLTSGIPSTQPRSSLSASRGLSAPAANSMLQPESAAGVRSKITIQEELQDVLDLSSLLGQAIKIAQTQISKVLKVRSEQTARLPIEKFLRYFALNRYFANECEAITGQSPKELNAVVDGQIREFISSFNETERQALLQSMDADRWDAVDFDGSANAVLSRLLEASTKDADTWTRLASPWAHDTYYSAGDIPNGTNTTVSSAKDKIRSAMVQEQHYILPRSAVGMLNGVERYQQLITAIPNMTSELTICLLEYHKLFESRLKQLILGAGATRSAGLKNITTKHLALASQALSFVIGLIPYVREFVRRHAGGAASGLMVKFDEVKRVFQEHQNGINEKLVDIMSARATTHVSSMKKIDWDSSTNDTGPNTYMETLTKETGTLQKVLAKHLPETTVKLIMDPVFASYEEQLGKAFQNAPLETSAGKKR